jgi:hypothetical protein
LLDDGGNYLYIFDKKKLNYLFFILKSLCLHFSSSLLASYDIAVPVVLRDCLSVICLLVVLLVCNPLFVVSTLTTTLKA